MSSRVISTIIQAQILMALRLRLDKKIEMDENFCLNDEPSIKHGYVLKKNDRCPRVDKEIQACNVQQYRDSGK